MTKRPSLIINLAGQHCQHTFHDLVEGVIRYDFGTAITEVSEFVRKADVHEVHTMLIDAAREAYRAIHELRLKGPRK